MADIVYLLRHAAPPADQRGKFWGRGDPGVDPASLASVPSLVPLFWERPTRMFTSPLARTVATAEAIAPALRLTPEAVPELAEADFGSFDGLSFGEIEAMHPVPARDWIAKGDAFMFPNGEAVPHFLHRATRAWEHCAGHPEPAVMAVTHGGIIACWCCLFLRMELEHRFAFRPQYAALTAFMRKKVGTGWELVFFNNRIAP